MFLCSLRYCLKCYFSNGVYSFTLSTVTQPWFQDDLEVAPNSRQAGLTERACRSYTHLTDANANSRAVFNESTLRLEDCNGSNGDPFRALSRVGPKVEPYEAWDSFSWCLVKIELPHYLCPMIGQQ